MDTLWHRTLMYMKHVQCIGTTNIQSCYLYLHYDISTSKAHIKFDRFMTNLQVLQCHSMANKNLKCKLINSNIG